MTDVTLRSIYEARRTINGIACRTPLVPAPALGGGDLDLRLKLETAQPTGAFKLRGAANAVARLPPRALERGVTCASTGNHGRAVAYAARRMGGRATVCMSRLVSEDGLTEIPPFDHADVIAGQGTIGIELLEDFPELDTVVVPLSGGGLIAGIARAVKSASPSVRVIGVSMRRGAAMHASLAAGRPIEVREEPTLADSLGGGIGLHNRLTFRMARELVDEVVLLSEAEIAAAMRRLFLAEGWVAEGGGAVGIALLEEPHRQLLGRRVAVVISGRGIDMAQFRQVIDGEVPFAGDAGDG